MCRITTGVFWYINEVTHTYIRSVPWTIKKKKKKENTYVGAIAFCDTLKSETTGARETMSLFGRFTFLKPGWQASNLNDTRSGRRTGRLSFVHGLPLDGVFGGLCSESDKVGFNSFAFRNAEQFLQQCQSAVRVVGCVCIGTMIS